MNNSNNILEDSQFYHWDNFTLDNYTRKQQKWLTLETPLNTYVVFSTHCANEQGKQ